MISTSVRRAAVLAAGLAVLAACSSDKEPASPSSSRTTGAGPGKVVVTITAADGCRADGASYGAGGLTFDVTNRDATGVSEVELLDGERIVGEKENLPPGFKGSFAINVEPGEYTLFCPGAK